MKKYFALSGLLAVCGIFANVAPTIRLKNDTLGQLAYGIYEKGRLSSDYVLVPGTQGILEQAQEVLVVRPAGRKTAAHKWIFRINDQSVNGPGLMNTNLPERIVGGPKNTELYGIHEYGLGLGNKGYNNLYVLSELNRMGNPSGRFEFETSK